MLPGPIERAQTVLATDSPINFFVTTRGIVAKSFDCTLQFVSGNKTIGRQNCGSESPLGNISYPASYLSKDGNYLFMVKALNMTNGTSFKDFDFTVVGNGNTTNSTSEANNITQVEVAVCPNDIPVICNGSKNADNLNGTILDDIIKGQGGDDFILGANGSDILVGGAGDDHISGGIRQ